MVTNYISRENLECYHKELMKHINGLVVNKAFEYTTCPNCAAVITGDKCDFCGTVFKYVNKLNSNLSDE